MVSGCGQNCPACGGCLQTGGQVAGAEILCRKESGQARRVTLVPVVVARNITWFAHAHCPEASSRCRFFFSQCDCARMPFHSVPLTRVGCFRRQLRSGTQAEAKPKAEPEPSAPGPTYQHRSDEGDAFQAVGGEAPHNTRTATAVGMLRWTRRRLRWNKKQTRGGSDSDFD